MARNLASDVDAIDVIAAFTAAIVIITFVVGTLLGYEPSTNLIVTIVTAAVAVLFGNYVRKRRKQ